MGEAEMELYRHAPAAGLLSQCRGRSTAGSFVLETKLSQIRASEASWCLVLPCFKCPLAAFQHIFLSLFTTRIHVHRNGPRVKHCWAEQEISGDFSAALRNTCSSSGFLVMQPTCSVPPRVALGNMLTSENTPDGCGSLGSVAGPLSPAREVFGNPLAPCLLVGSRVGPQLGGARSIPIAALLQSRMAIKWLTLGLAQEFFLSQTVPDVKFQPCSAVRSVRLAKGASSLITGSI